MSTSTGFPSLKPALTLKGNLGRISPVGVTKTGANLTHFEISSGSIESVPGFEPAFKSEIHFGADWLSVDPNGERARMDVRGMAQTPEGEGIYMEGSGVIELAGPMGKIFTGAPDMATTPFGYTTATITLTTGEGRLKELDRKFFIANSRFIVNPDKTLSVDMKLSVAVPSTDAE